MMKGKNYKTSKRWKFMVILDNNKNKIKTIELNEDQKLMCPLARNKKRRLNYDLKTSTALDNESNENSENETNSTTHFSFHEEIIFSYRNDSQNFSNGKDHDFLSIEPNTNINLSIFEDGYFGKTYSENIDTDFQENVFLDGNENIEGMLL